MTNTFVPVFFVLLTSAVVGQTGRVGIGTTDPFARLHVEDSSVLFRGTWNTATPSPLPIEGPGVRLMWYPDLAAFRAGRVSTNAWDSVNVGKCSFAGGFSTIASQFGSTAFGNHAKAIASNATALGYQTIASGKESTASGYGVNAESKASFAVGRFNVGGGDSLDWISTDPLFEVGMGTGPANEQRANAMTIYKNGGVIWNGEIDLEVPDPVPVEGLGTRMVWYPEKAAFRAGGLTGAAVDQWDTENIGKWSIALGRSPWASADHSVSIGFFTYATETSAVALGHQAIANGKFSVALGNSTTSGYFSTSMGRGTNADAFCSVALGRNNIGGGTYNTWVPDDPIFEVGVGLDSSRNALTVLKNGNVGIGTHTPTSELHVVGIIEVDNTIRASDSDGLYLLPNSSPYGIYVKDNGSVGIGTNTPQTKLHVAGNIELNNSIQAEGPGGVNLCTDDLFIRLKVHDNGNIGVGTTIPNKRLHVLGEGRFESNTGGAQIILDGSSGLNEVEFQQNGAYRAGIGYDHTAGRIYLYHGGNVVVKSGNLGVGVDPVHRIDVSGGAYCDGSTWTNSSSRDLKENFAELNSRDILEKVCGLDITRWNYKDDSAESLHIGPMAEDFYAAFGLGQDDKSISTVDISGVALLTIQAQQKEINELNIAIEQLRSDKAEMQEAIEYLLERMESLSGENE